MLKFACCTQVRQRPKRQEIEDMPTSMLPTNLKLLDLQICSHALQNMVPQVSHLVIYVLGSKFKWSREEKIQCSLLSSFFLLSFFFCLEFNHDFLESLPKFKMEKRSNIFLILFSLFPRSISRGVLYARKKLGF